MTWFVLRKLAVLLAIVLATAAIAWWLLAAVPDSGGGARDFFSWLGHLLVGNFGIAASGDAVGTMLAGRLAVTLPLAFLAMLFGVPVGFGLGWLAALRPRSLLDRLVRALGEIGIATPNFWLGMMLVLALASGLHWLPPGGFVPWQESAPAALGSLILPALALAAPASAALALQMRAALVVSAQSPAVLGARARGTTRREAIRRGWLPALLSLGAPLATQLAAVVAGTVIVENVFYLPGLGRLILDAVGAHDTTTLCGGLVVLVTLIAGIRVVAQIAFAWLDPRRRAEMAE